MNYKNYIKNQIIQILSKEPIVEIPPKENMGDYSVPCFELRNDELKSPFDVSNYIKEKFKDEKEYFEKIEILGPYVNFYLKKELLNNTILEIEGNKNYGSLNQGKGEELLIEHTSINPNASPHIGRTRNSMIGDFLSRLYAFTGHKVERHYFVNDIGKQIAMLLIGTEKYGSDNLSFNEMLDIYIKINNDAKQDENIEKLAKEYLNKLENGNEEVREKFKNLTDICVEGQRNILKQIDIDFDVFTHESDFVFDDIIKDILNKIDKTGRLKEDENGRYYVDLTGYDIPTKSPVLVLTREDKTSLYPLRDIAYTIYKENLNSKNNFIVLGEDQITYMKQISAVMDILGYNYPELINYSFVLLDGAKMATREGTLVLLEDFVKATNEKLEESFKERNLFVDKESLSILSNACIKYSMLNVSREKCVNFNWEKATSFNGESGIYILYNIVRINSILKNNEIKDTELLFENEIEYKILKDLYNFPEVIDNLLKTKEPTQLSKYIFNLTQKFSKFYEEVNISKETNEQLKNSRLRLLNATKQVLSSALSILGIKTVEKM